MLNKELQNDTYLDSLESTKSNLSSIGVEEAINTSVICDNNDSFFVDENECSESVVGLEDNTEINEEHIRESTNNIPVLTDISHCNNVKSLWADIQTFIIERNISHNSGNELLRILRLHGHVELPRDVRVLLHTPRNASATIILMSDGHYAHFGITSGLEIAIRKYSTFIATDEIKINVNIDGLPLSKSSSSQFWPIMASIEGIDVHTLPFIIGVYHGMSKPNNANEFLDRFVNELMFLSENGINVYNKKYSLILNAILCDAPAKSFITYTKGHAGYFSCSKCIQEGDFVQNRVTFPETNSSLRTNDSFKDRIQIEHHTGNSILEKLAFGMVSQIPLDYMHLVCLGVVKRLLQLWLRGNKDIRLLPADVHLASQHLIAIGHSIPSEFARKPRSINDVDNWKATEFRQFLLYTGMIIMKSKLSPTCYNHFLALCVAIRILADPQLCIIFNDYANSLLLWFVSNYGAIYGEKYLSHNVHNLLHLANDVHTFGCLDNFSCFKYENHMQIIKKKLHQSGKPLQELTNRIFEDLRQPNIQSPIVKYPTIVYTSNNTIKYVQYKNFKLATNEVDKCALWNDKSVIFILDIFEEDVIYFQVKRFLNPKSLFTKPCASERLGIYVISKTTTYDIITVPITEIKQKCLILKYIDEVDSYVTIPLLHTNN